MGVFVVLLMVPILLQHISFKGHYIDYQKRNSAALFFFFLMLTLLVMLRHEDVGNDTRNYIHFFERFSLMDWSKLKDYGLEVGFAYLNKVISLVSKEPRFFLIVAAIAMTVMIYPTYKRLCLDASLTIVLFVNMSTFVMMFSGIRQMLAVGIGFIAYEFTRRKKLFSFVLMVILAMTIHTSAFMLALMYPVYHTKVTKKWLYVVVPVLTIVFMFNKSIFSVLAAIIGRFTKYDGSVSPTGAYSMLILFAIFTVFAFLIPNDVMLDEEAIGMRNFLLLSLIVQIFAPLHTLAMRMNYYYIIFIPLLLPKIIECRSKRWDHVAVLGRRIMVVLFVAYFMAVAYQGGVLNVFPYHFFWESVG